MKQKIAVLAVIAVALYSCNSSKSTTKTTEVKEVKATEVVLTEELAKGKTSYENNCAKCHKLYDTKQFNAQEWTPILQRMQKKAHIDDAERDRIYAYVTMK